MKIQEIFEFLDGKYPVSSACDFDNVGLLVGDKNAELSGILVCLDCTVEAVEKAENEGCNLIVSHHPVIFDPIKNALADSIVYKLINKGISVISMHTNLDMGDGGVNDCLCKAIGLDDISPLVSEDGFILKSGVCPALSAENFADKLKTVLGGRIKFVDGGKEISRVLVCSGSGGEFIVDAIDGGFDALVTSDIKHHTFLVAKENGVSLFDAGHFETEDVCVEPLKALLQTNFVDLKIISHHPNYLLYK